MDESRLDKVRLAAAVLADPEDDRDLGLIEEDFGWATGTIKELMVKCPEFEEELEVGLRRQAALERAAVIKSLSRKAREGSVQHQKFYLDLLEKLAGRVDGESMTVELVLVDADKTDDR